MAGGGGGGSGNYRRQNSLYTQWPVKCLFITNQSLKSSGGDTEASKAPQWWDPPMPGNSSTAVHDHDDGGSARSERFVTGSI